MSRNAAAKPLDVSAWATLLTSPGGHEQLVRMVREARQRGGRQWLAEIKTEFPTLCWIVELVATKTADESITELSKLNPLASLFASQIKTLHWKLLEEIERKR